MYAACEEWEQKPPFALALIYFHKLLLIQSWGELVLYGGNRDLERHGSVVSRSIILCPSFEDGVGRLIIVLTTVSVSLLAERIPSQCTFHSRLFVHSQPTRKPALVGLTFSVIPPPWFSFPAVKLRLPSG